MPLGFMSASGTPIKKLIDYVYSAENIGKMGMDFWDKFHLQ